MAGKRNADLGGLRMFGDVRQRLLQDAEQRDGDARRQRHGFIVVPEVAGDAGALGKFRHFIVDGGDNAEGVERAGAQTARDIARGPGAFVDQRFDILDFAFQFWRVFQVTAEPGHVQFGGGEQAAEIIMHFARNGDALLFAHVLDVGG